MRGMLAPVGARRGRATLFLVRVFVLLFLFMLQPCSARINPPTTSGSSGDSGLTTWRSRSQIPVAFGSQNAKPAGSTQIGGAFATTTSFGTSSSSTTSSSEHFQTRDSRNGFIRKVYSIFLAQLLTTVVFTATVMKNPGLQLFLISNYPLIGTLSAVISTAVALVLTLFRSVRERSPVNFVLLALYTLLQSVTVSVFSSLVNPRTVCLGTMHSLTALAAITLYSLNTQHDLTTLGNTLLAASTTAVVGVILGAVFKMPFLDNLAAGGFAVIFAAYLAYDTQMIVGGQKRKHQYRPKDYILAALTLYQDIIALFFQIVKILVALDKKGRGHSRRNN